jgi:uncharacterized phage-like protein YoqJ
MSTLHSLLDTPRIVAGTGHRPDKLGGFDAHTSQRLFDMAQATLKHFQPTAVISGMALGWNWALAEGALALGIPLIAAVPFAGQEKRWQPAAQARYHQILTQACVEIVSPGGYSTRAMQVRNIWMVNRCHLLLALWNGTSGGTANCLDYANAEGCKVFNLWKSWETFK